MALIRSLRPNVTREEAVQHLSPDGLVELGRQLAFGSLRSIANFYIPFQLFEVEITNAGNRDTRILGLDRVNGSLDLYDFDQRPPEAQMIEVETRNFLEPQLDSAEINKKVIEKVQRVLFSRGFFRMRNLEIKANPIGDVYVPYWVGFRGSDAVSRITVMDAIRRKVEGAKVRHLLETWLRHKHCKNYRDDGNLNS
jgi:hypothetical protein